MDWEVRWEKFIRARRNVFVDLVLRRSQVIREEINKGFKKHSTQGEILLQFLSKNLFIYLFPRYYL